MEALSPDEVARAVELLKAAGLADGNTLFPQIALFEMPKAAVLAWTPGAPVTRKADVIFRKAGETYEALIDLDAGNVVLSRKVPGAEPMILDGEWNLARDRFIADPRFKAALARRGYAAEGASVFCTPASAGYFPGEGYEGRRILKIPCYDNNQKLHPQLARPIEGLMGVVDSETGEVLAVIDNESVPLPPAPRGYGSDLPPPRPPLNAVDIVADLGGNIRISGNLEIGWLDWSFHLRPDKRAGLVLSLVRFDDNGRNRLIAYRMNVSEMFVPYMDPNPEWAYRTFMDVGEFGLGYLISSLREGADCPVSALYADLTFPGDDGSVYTRKNALCIFERATGDPAWRHSSGSQNPPDAGRKSNLS